MDWKQRQKECKKCKGRGYTASEAKHEDGRGSNAWAVRCECQPRTLEELEEAAAQEASELKA
jgi:hypothetical protein